MKEKNDILNLLNKIYDNPSYSQRNLASKLGFSIGKINYCLQALKSKGWIKIRNFRNNKNKINYIYILTPKGIDQKIKLTKKFIRIKMNEYEELNIALKKQQKDIQVKNK